MFSLDTEENRRILVDFLSLCFSSWDNELEIRFSTFVRQNLFPERGVADDRNKPSNFSFTPVIERSIFFKTLSTFEQYGLQKKCEKTIDYSYDGYLRKTQWENGDERWMKKTKSKYHDFWDANLRLSLATEIPHNFQNDTTKPTAVKMMRKKDRTSFFDNDVRYDFTVVENCNGNGRDDGRVSYEIEIEFIGNKMFFESGNRNAGRPSRQLMENASKHLIYCVMHMLELLSSSPCIATLSEKHNILLEYANLYSGGRDHLSRPYFLGAQPETLHKHHVAKVLNGYSLTEKYDGERYLLFISDNGFVYLFDRRLRIRNTGLRNEEYRGSLLDCEVLDRHIFPFDILFLSGTDLRGSAEHHLRTRLGLLDNVVLSISADRNGPFNITAKKHFIDDFNEAFTRWTENSYEDTIPRDGFIFTPLNEPYPTKPKWNNLLKWKPVEMNTIDFMLKKKEGRVFTLLVGDKDVEVRNVLFEPCSQILIPDELVASLSISDNSIVECYWDNAVGTFVPWRCREDKNKPNFKTVAMDVWQNIQNPVDISDLQKTPFSTMRKFHNMIKSDMIKKGVGIIQSEKGSCLQENKSWADMSDEDDYLDNTLRILDLACGRGGDLWKWTTNDWDGCSIDYFGIDIDENLLKEAEERYKEVKAKASSKNRTIDCRFAHCDLSRRTPNIPYPPNSFDVVSCQFALHYFFESNETFSTFMETVEKNVKKNGVLLFSLFDGFAVYELCAKGFNKHPLSSFQIQPSFDTRMGLSNIKKKEFGIGITAAITSKEDVILNKPTTEYLVFADLFLKRMQTRGWKLTESRLFSDIPLKEEFNLTEYEALYSQLHRTYIFVYKPEEVLHHPLRNLFSEWTLKDEHREEILKLTNLPDFTDVDLLVSQTRFLYKDCTTLKKYNGTPTDHGYPDIKDCMTSTVEMVTGKHSVPINAYSDTALDTDVLAEHFNVFLGVIPVDEFLEPKTEAVVISKPASYLEDVKMLYFLYHMPTEHYFPLIHTAWNDDHAMKFGCYSFPAPVEEQNDHIETDIDVDAEESSSSSEGEKRMEEDVPSIPDDVPVLDGVPVQQDAEIPLNDEVFLGRPINKGKNAWTVKSLQEYAKEQGIKIPSSVRKKMDIITFFGRGQTVENRVAM